MTLYIIDMVSEKNYKIMRLYLSEHSAEPIMNIEIIQGGTNYVYSNFVCDERSLFWKKS